ncbi:EpsG family protein [Candidatus Saccharibacteria bacterium]|nr:EpsG family protein [Candidatus Saccharibacteria bacterium]
MDLSRLFSALDATRLNGAGYLFGASDYAGLPVASAFFYVISLFNNNHLLPFFACFLYYFLTTYVVIHYTEKNNKSKVGMVVALVLFYFVSNYLGVISEIRNPLAISLFCFLVYFDLGSGFRNFKFIIGYILLCLLHPSMVILLIIRMLLFLNKRNDGIISILLLLWSSFKWVIVSVLGAISGSTFVGLLMQKLTAYDMDEAKAVANVGLYTAIYLGVYAFVYVLYRMLLAKIKKEEGGIEKYRNNIRLFRFVFAFFLGSIFEYHLFVRFSRLIVCFGVFIFIDLISKEKKRFNKLIYALLLLSVAMALLVFYFMGQYLVLIQ